MERSPRLKEAAALENPAQNEVISIVKREDGLFHCYQDSLLFDEEEGVHYWSRSMMPLNGLFGNIEEAKAEYNFD